MVVESPQCFWLCLCLRLAYKRLVHYYREQERTKSWQRLRLVMCGVKQQTNERPLVSHAHRRGFFMSTVETRNVNVFWLVLFIAFYYNDALITSALSSSATQEYISPIRLYKLFSLFKHIHCLTFN